MAQQHHESSFEVEICEHLAAHGWLYSPKDAGYDRELALFPEDVFGWLADTQPEQLAKRVKPDLTGEALAKARQGVLATLVKTLGADPKANGGTLVGAATRDSRTSTPSSRCASSAPTPR